MPHLRIIFLFFFLPSFLFASPSETVPSLYKGRVRPLFSIAQEKKIPLEDAFLSEKILPLKSPPGEWAKLDTLKNATTNFTLYDDATFKTLKLNDPNTFIQAYKAIENTPIDDTLTNPLTYPSFFRIQTEWIFTKYPWMEITFVLYTLALISSILCLTLHSSSLTKIAFGLTLTAFLFHTALLSFRIIILQRPPVSNMVETMLFVPWISSCIGLVLSFFTKGTIKRLILLSLSFIPLSLLALIRLTQMHEGLENVQAVLNSQLWLTVHVLMVVGSYGAFILSALLGHLFLFSYLFNQTKYLDVLGNSILQTMYIGCALLIPGTILGGVWALESWGRFWDWDPKESWAFISSCIYLIFIHAYRFQKIQYQGLAIGSIVGLLAISFTWYGVNYILGTGLHTYGFGTGGILPYALFVGFELFLILTFLILSKKRVQLI